VTPLQFERELIAALPKLGQLAAELTATREEAEDLVQDTLVEALTYRDDFNPANVRMGLWLGRIAVNLAGHAAPYIFPHQRRTACAS
jgi:RNA polymerase sigma-70 factor, ECF subfamily